MYDQSEPIWQRRNRTVYKIGLAAGRRLRQPPMHDLPTRYELTVCGTSGRETAEFVPLTRDLAKLKIDAAWWVGLGVSGTARRAEPDHGWKWVSAVVKSRMEGFTECWAVQTADGDIQAAIVYRADALSELDRDDQGRPRPAVYCGYLATAPRNRGRLVAAPKYRGAGSGLLLRAIAQSYGLGFGGRINLASLPHPDTVAFYTAAGFVETGTESEGMMIYELRPEPAQGKLVKAGWL